MATAPSYSAIELEVPLAQAAKLLNWSEALVWQACQPLKKEVSSYKPSTLIPWSRLLRRIEAIRESQQELAMPVKQQEKAPEQKPVRPLFQPDSRYLKNGLVAKTYYRQ